ncbi:MAG: acetyl-CoA decarbonylase/synthase complex subunit alpha/beta [Desulfobacterales bacterium]|jgi:acetyl-CoA synthase|nr:CO dehydrogenase/CO-methylating acetyl-CoA synthase complex subunit beta [Desulfobacter sp.]MDP6394909.1 acetyl-CoA decarbonylase/synthase complex subunit alpha/beta [Desulfobacterales bacterium]MDP6682415.1 acetyl-CoA decarbonylase/synthase complex subunit alpha/beta [Desulfobacterales bacterium]MDP6807166.1 acetyl-CoA decarbonylase/synthase complex subunit alpha/beta [Desulfobacterales bacterium]|tara:strand:- start:3908 stop:6124 length:2217 start_codon:yes stop_codon:yes gene_type:complete
MSRLVAFAAIQGGYNIVSKVEGEYQKALQTYNADTSIGFPNTAYYLPVIYSLLGMKVETLEDMKKPLEFARGLLPPHVKGQNHLPYLGPLLDAGMAALFAFEIQEALRYLNDPDFYLHSEDIDEEAGRIWLGAADDTVFRKRGVEFVDGTAPGFAAVVGSAPDPETAKMIVEEYQRRSLYIFCAANQNGTTVTEQLLEAEVQIGWSTRIVPFGPDISSAIFALGFANRAAMAFGGVEPGDYKKMLIYNKDRIFAFVNALGDVNAEWAAAAAGCVNWGFPTLADTDIPEILPTGICTYEHVVANVSHDEMVQKSVEVRGLKTTVASIDIPCAFGPAYEGERVRGADLFSQMGGGKSQATELVEMADMKEIDDAKVELIGKDIGDIKEGENIPLGIYVQVAGREMQPDFEPILERQIHHLINYIQGIMHIGQRDITWIRLGKPAVEKGFTLKDIGVVLHAKFHQDFGAILDKVQVTLYTNKKDVDGLTKRAKAEYKQRDERVETMADEDVETYYSCTLCQSFAPTHVCTVSPERTGLCGAYNWMDCKASFEINPTGPNQPIEKGECLDPELGQWKGVNEFVSQASRGAIDHYNFYSMINDPMTTCGCCECIAATLPTCNGVMTVSREYAGETPCGMKFTTLAGVMGGGASSPGFVGHSKFNITQKKFIKGDGGLLRMVWMPLILKEEIKERLIKEGKELGVPDFYDMIADETVGITEEEILPFLQEKGHPALSMDSIIGE